DLLGGASRRLGGFRSPGDYATFKFPPPSRHDPIIYRDGAGPRWGCRICLKGRYLSEPMSPKDRRLHAAFKVRERLGQTKGGILVSFPAKPKGMHWRTYTQIRLTAVLTEHEILIQATANLYGLTLEQAKNQYSSLL
ncbi:hypothetical protein ACSSV8_003875, partial [Roseovarius sp. MBR-79]